MTEVSESMYCVYIGYVHCNIEKKKKESERLVLSLPPSPNLTDYSPALPASFSVVSSSKGANGHLK